MGEFIMTTIYCVRHGQSEANLAQIMQGSKIDTPLTKLGKQQALAAKAKLATVSFDAVYASPLKRAVQTAKLISSATPTLDDRLVEFDYGTWDGQLLSDLYTNIQRILMSIATYYLTHGKFPGDRPMRKLLPNLKVF